MNRRMVNGEIQDATGRKFLYRHSRCLRGDSSELPPDSLPQRLERESLPCG